MSNQCVLCQSEGGELIWQNALCRVVLVHDADYAGFCRVILNRHEKEMTDLSEQEQVALMQIVFQVERVVRKVMQADKINLASLGNKTPHIHWHIIPRYQDDKHFPETIWSQSQRETSANHQSAITELRELLKQTLSQTVL